MARVELDELIPDFADSSGEATHPKERSVLRFDLRPAAIRWKSSLTRERRCTEDIVFRSSSANECPDHATIAPFARDHEEELVQLFDRVLRLAAGMGLVRVGLIALDSTRIKANASPGAPLRRLEPTEVERIIKGPRLPTTLRSASGVCVPFTLRT